MTISHRLAALGAAAALAVVGVGGFAVAANASPAPAAAAAGAPVSVKPGTVTVDQTFAVSGGGCLPFATGAPATVFVDVGNFDGSFAATPNSDGFWSVNITASQIGVGTWPVLATCDGYLAAGFYQNGSVTITLVATTTTSASATTSAPTSTAPSTSSPATSTPATSTATSVSTATTVKSTAASLTLVGYTGQVEQGGSLGIDATGFDPGEKVTVTLHSAPVLLTTLIADGSGRASGTVTIPLDTPIGAHTITLVGQLSGRSLEAPINVVASAETSASTPLTGSTEPVATATLTPVVETVVSSGLANTGVNAGAMTVWGVVLLIAGGIAVVLARKRDSKHAGD
jgi:hypothetical protein